MTYPASSGIERDDALVSAPWSGWNGRKVRLREIRPADRPILMRFDRAAARGDERQIGGYQHWAAHRAGADGTHQLAIESLHGRMLVGSISAIQADRDPDRFSYGIGIGPQYRRCGYAGDAIIVLLTIMFEQGYRRCEVGIDGGNLASLSLHGVLGFQEEYRLRDAELWRGRIRYQVRMSITAHEFATLHPNITPSRSRQGRHGRPRRGRHWQS
jgi:RimJ/RimL family protein N-acetyltransferase